MSFKRAKVVMLPTNKKAQIYQIGNSSFISNIKHDDRYYGRNLYITSNEEIKENAWLYSKMDGYPIQWDGDLSETKNPKEYGYNKIIATTDKSIKLSVEQFDGVHSWNYPQPSQQFIEKYSSEYNKGNIITDILVEYNIIPFSQDAPNRDRGDGSLRINPKDNTITIKRIKDSWNKEEHIADIYKAMKVLIDTHHLHYEYYQEQLTNWIKENI